MPDMLELIHEQGQVGIIGPALALVNQGRVVYFLYHEDNIHSQATPNASKRMFLIGASRL